MSNGSGSGLGLLGLLVVIPLAGLSYEKRKKNKLVGKKYRFFAHNGSGFDYLYLYKAIYK